MTFRGRRADPKHFRRFIHGQPGKVTQFYQLGFLGMVRRKLIECVMDIEQFALRDRDRNFDIIDIDALQSSTVPCRAFATGAINEYAAHRFRRCAEEMPAALPTLRLPTDANPCFVHERSGLQSMTRRLPIHLLRSDLPQLLINERQELIRRNSAFATDLIEEPCEIVHWLRGYNLENFPAKPARASEFADACCRAKLNAQSANNDESRGLAPSRRKLPSHHPVVPAKGIVRKSRGEHIVCGIRHNVQSHR